MTRFRKWLKILGLSALALLLLAMALPYAFPIAPYDAAITGPFPESRTAVLAGARIHYRYWQPATAPKGNIVLVHGFCGSTFSWRKNIPFLVEKGFRVLAVDMPSFGYSDRSPEMNRGMAASNAYVWGAVDAAAQENAIPAGERWWLAGHSMGGGIIEGMGQVAPERVAGLIFVDGGGFGNEGAGGVISSGIRTVLSIGPLRRWVEVYAKHRAFTESNIRTLLASAFGEEPDDEAVRGYLDALKVPRTASAILDLARARSSAEIKLDAASITAPALIVWGEQDSWLPLERGKRLNEQIKGSEMAVIPGTGHNCMETRPKEFNEAVWKFLEKHTAVAAS
ncbi:MAG: alpha/beta hydrolase [Candidatus Hydrogenedentes bacterium]|nr:alpha/beta hydrolase [Candidatus Hydrogenedentota bacterium]